MKSQEGEGGFRLKYLIRENPPLRLNIGLNLHFSLCTCQWSGGSEGGVIVQEGAGQLMAGMIVLRS